MVKNGREVCSNVIASQIALHTLYGGVVPEIASRKHIEKINQVIEEALSTAGYGFDFPRQIPSVNTPVTRLILPEQVHLFHGLLA